MAGGQQRPLGLGGGKPRAAQRSPRSCTGRPGWGEGGQPGRWGAGAPPAPPPLRFLPCRRGRRKLLTAEYGPGWQATPAIASPPTTPTRPVSPVADGGPHACPCPCLMGRSASSRMSGRMAAIGGGGPSTAAAKPTPWERGHTTENKGRPGTGEWPPRGPGAPAARPAAARSGPGPWRRWSPARAAPVAAAPAARPPRAAGGSGGAGVANGHREQHLHETPPG